MTTITIEIDDSGAIVLQGADGAEYAEYGLEGSHHADIEYGRSITQCEEAIREIENLR